MEEQDFLSKRKECFSSTTEEATEIRKMMIRVQQQNVQFTLARYHQAKSDSKTAHVATAIVAGVVIQGITRFFPKWGDDEDAPPTTPARL